jgi:hypothetical protein
MWIKVTVLVSILLLLGAVLIWLARWGRKTRLERDNAGLSIQNEWDQAKSRKDYRGMMRLYLTQPGPTNVTNLLASLVILFVMAFFAFAGWAIWFRT